jgi:predicted ATPase
MLGTCECSTLADLRKLSALLTVARYCVFLNSCMFGEVDAGNRYGEIAIRIIERFHSKQWQGRVGIIVDSFVKGWKYNISEYVNSMRMASQLSLATGDTEVSRTPCTLCCLTVSTLGSQVLTP